MTPIELVCFHHAGGGSASFHPLHRALAALGVILSSTYALWLFRRVVWGALTKPALKAMVDLTPREIAILAPLLVLVIFFGVYPAPVLDACAASVEAIIRNYHAAISAGGQTAALGSFPLFR